MIGRLILGGYIGNKANELNKPIVACEVNNPTAQVKITNDITLGFININKDFR